MITAKIHHLFILRLKNDIRTYKITLKKGTDVIDIKLQNQ